MWLRLGQTRKKSSPTWRQEKKESSPVWKQREIEQDTTWIQRKIIQKNVSTAWRRRKNQSKGKTWNDIRTEICHFH